MLSIPTISEKKTPWLFKCVGKSSKINKEIIEEIVKYTLFYEKVISKRIYLDMILCSKTEIQEFNKKFSKIEKPTDILTFLPENFNKEDKKKEILNLGSMLLCIPIIKEDAEFNKKHFLKHLAHL